MDWSEYQARVALHDQHLESLLATARAYADTYQELQARHCLRATAPSSLLRRRAADLQRQAETSCKRNIGLKARPAMSNVATAGPSPDTVHHVPLTVTPTPLPTNSPRRQMALT
ncbi:uncharacterized protein MONBRDRAFT_23593 [Monosiga brevicollis MX1]|uniref:Uncharacterized protein n=1 Tax=Monosiga brevicollis TaxID=81824 RepID=A9UTW6_MONBE|nr:uncharacterized protein MONBRDRAFT_23593 [Monosiga brevicollis MX1]EDQ91565.1 predicted protein [Monosiga brevicollis MX1]|eukprot:XP_001743987.1 hypothetical protein [Monosiga brevicollis MX1]